MNITRRKLLKLLGIGAVAASFPLAPYIAEAKEIEAKEATQLGGIVAGELQTGPVQKDSAQANYGSYALVGIRWAYGTHMDTLPDGTRGEVPTYYGDWMKIGTIDSRAFRQVQGHNHGVFSPCDITHEAWHRIDSEPITSDMIEEAHSLLLEQSKKKLKKINPYACWDHDVTNVTQHVEEKFSDMKDVVEASFLFEPQY
jgi:hypothetical protein